MTEAQHLNWGAEALWQRLEPLLPGLSVEVVSRTDSTNSQLLARCRADGGRRAGDLQPCLLVAEQQTHGRGRLGRDWVSSAGASLTFSLALPLEPADWAGLSLAVGLSLADALDAGPAPRLGLKWPNDLWLLDDAAQARGRKLGGVLIETATVGPHRVAVIGVGLNVLPQTIEGLTHGYACLQELDPETSAPAVLARVAAPLVQTLRSFEREGFAGFEAGFARRDVLRGHAITASGAAAVDGVAEGVDARGALLLRAAPNEGDVHRIVSGEVSVRLSGPAC